MKDYPREKYKIFTGPNKVIAVSTYAGRVVRGVAKCAPGDTFDIEKGKDLAIARCAAKIAEKRLRRAANKKHEAELAIYEANSHYDRMMTYLDDSYTALNTAEERVKQLERDM